MKFPKTLLVLLGILCAALIVYVGIKAWNGYSEHYRIGIAVRDRDTITVGGEGKVSTTPDIARVSLGVQIDATTVKAAQAENTKKMNAIIDAIKVLGVAKEDITTANYSIYPKTEWNDGKSTIIGYTVSQNMSVKVRDLDKVGDVLAKAGELGANQVGGISFTIDEPKLLQDEARLKAISDARKKADVLAKQLGLTILKVVTFSESGGPMPSPMPYYAKSTDMALEAAAPPQIEPGQQDVVSNVNVTFEVR
ncbi:MAG TPA: SIMPL domain-containing protein [Candidatus Methylomirabilis sp.]|nr:SIMPL domain-containing protein [Candidatus Methylomirabilis sp.]